MKFKPIQVLLCVVALVSVFVATGCPKKPADEQIRSAAEASYRLPGLIVDLTNKVTEARDLGLISAEKAREFGGWLSQCANGSVGFVQAVKAADAIWRRTGNVPKSQIELIQSMFDDEIVAPFLKILELFNVLSGSAAGVIRAAIVAVRVVLATIGTGFGSSFLNVLRADGSPGSIQPAAALIPEVRFA